MKKRNLVSLILVLLVINCFVISACAAHVTDDAGLFSDSEREYLEQRATEISEKYNFGVYIVTLENFLNYHGSSNIERFTMNYYDEHGFGYGDDKAGTTLLLSMAERDYDLDFNSDRANEIFTYSGREDMKSRFLAYFRQNDFYHGFSEYLDTCEEYLQAAEDGTPVGAGDAIPDDYWDNYTNYDDEGLPLWVAVIPGAIAAILAGVLTSIPMHSAKEKRDADVYRVPGSLDIRRRSDMFLHRSVTRTPRETESSSSGGSHNYSSGSHSGSSGKF